MEQLKEIKIKLLARINKALDSEKGISAETVGHFLNGIAKLEENEIILSQKPLDYERVVNDVKEVVKELPCSTDNFSETI